MNVYFIDPSLLNIERLSYLLEILQVNLCYDITMTASFYEEAHRFIPSLRRLSCDKETQEEDVKRSVHSFLSPYDEPKFIDGCVCLDYLIKNVSDESGYGNPLYNLTHTNDSNVFVFYDEKKYLGIFFNYLRNIIKKNKFAFKVQNNSLERNHEIKKEALFVLLEMFVPPCFTQKICYCTLSRSMLCNSKIFETNSNRWMSLTRETTIKEPYEKERFREVRFKYDLLLSYIHRILNEKYSDIYKEECVSEFFLRKECYKDSLEKLIIAKEEAEERVQDSAYYEDDRDYYASELKYIMNNGGDWIND